MNFSQIINSSLDNDNIEMGFIKMMGPFLGTFTAIFLGEFGDKVY